MIGRQARVHGLQRIADVPIYFADPLVRRSAPLQDTLDAAEPDASMSGATLQRLGLGEADRVRVVQGTGEAELVVSRDDGVPADCVRIPAGHRLTAGLGAMLGTVQVTRVTVDVKVKA